MNVAARRWVCWDHRRRKLVSGAALLILTAVFLIVLTQPVRAVDAPRASITTLAREIGRAPDFRATSISPDGRSIAWVRSVSSSGTAWCSGTEIYLSSIRSSSKAIRVTAASQHQQVNRCEIQEGSIAWSPNGAELAFLSDARTPGQTQLYLMRIADKSVRRLTRVTGDLQDPKWSHNGHSIAVLFTAHARRAPGPLAAVPPQTGVIGQSVHEQRILVVNSVTGKARLDSPTDLYVYQYDWSPNDSRFAVTAAHGSGDNNWYIAGLYLIDATTGDTRLLLKPSTQIAVPRWSPDGRQIAFIAGLMSDEGVANGDLHLISAAGGKDQDVTPNLKASVFWFSWLRHSTEIVLAEARDGGSAVVRLNPITTKRATLWQGGQSMRAVPGFARSLSLTSNGAESAVILESYDQAPTLQVGAVGKWRILRPTAILPKDIPWGVAKNVHWQSGDFTVQGWLLPPKNLVPGRKYPMIVWVHGGPAWLNTPAWPTSHEGRLYYAGIDLLAAEGYFIFMPNPRGSAGWGESFEHANVKDFGGGDFRDIIAGVHKVVATEPIDQHRIGISGWSYGGYMTMWAVTQTNLFRAAVADAGLNDWLSYYGENGIDQWMMPYFGASVYDDPAVYAKSAPINFIKRVHTPTLIMVGEDDVECPVPQSFEFWHALKSLHVKTMLVVYPNEGHEFWKPKDYLNVLSRTLAWFDSNMPKS